MLKRHVVSLTTDGSGNASGMTPPIHGYVESIRYIKTDFTNGVDFTIAVGGASGPTILTEANVDASITKYPRAPASTTAGAAITDSGEKIPLVSDPIYIGIANGGAAHTGTFEIITSGP
jgi:hypothetical protein